MAKKKEEATEEIVETVEVKEKTKRQIFIENRLEAINRIQDEGKAKRAANTLFRRKGN